MKSFVTSCGALCLSFASLFSAPAVANDSARRDVWEEVAARVDARLDHPSIAHSHWGVLIESLDTGGIYYERNADRTFIPASNQKLPVAAAAYRSLGPDFTFTTTVHRRGEVTDGTLEGDLVVRGNGDPTLYERWHDDSRDVFRRWALELKEAGIGRIAGNIVGDDNAWEDRHFGSSWPRGSVVPWYYAEFGPLTFNENYVDLRFVPPDEPGGEVRIEPNVESDYFELVNEIAVVESGRNSVSMDRPMFSNTFTLTGRVVAGSGPFEQTPSITNPTLFYVTVLREVLEAEGIEVEGQAVDCDDLEDWEASPEELPEVARHVSPPLREIIPMFLKRSQNMYGENLVFTMGWNREGRGTFSAGRSVVRDELRAFGIDPDDYRFSDGSGLSRYNLISPRTIVAINRGMRESDLGDLWLESQSVAGVDGTLRGWRQDAIRGNVRGKTGTLTGVRALSGFVTTADGEEVLFSILNNGNLTGTGSVDAVTRDVLTMVAEIGTQLAE